MITLGSMSALAERDGVMHLNEAWVVLGAGVAEMDAIGRTVRSLPGFPISYTQQCTDPLRAGQAGTFLGSRSCRLRTRPRPAPRVA